MQTQTHAAHLQDITKDGPGAAGGAGPSQPVKAANAQDFADERELAEDYDAGASGSQAPVYAPLQPGWVCTAHVVCRWLL